MAKMIEKINILGVGISAIDRNDALQQMEHWIRTREQHYICVCPNHTIMESQKNKRLRRIVNSAGLVTPDGMSVVWGGKLLGNSYIEQVCGSDLMLSFCALAAKKGYTNFFYGGAEGVPELLTEKLCKRFPGLKVVGIYSPPFRPLTTAEDKAVIEIINQANPDVVWVSLGAPKQEFWMADHIEHISSPVMIGVGAAFDFLSGRKRRPPQWMQRNGLEWLFRLLQEPCRLWRRNLYHPLFFYKLLLQWIGLKQFKL